MFRDQTTILEMGKRPTESYHLWSEGTKILLEELSEKKISAKLWLFVNGKSSNWHFFLMLMARLHLQ